MPTPTTQTRHPWRATARTLFAAIVGTLSLLPTIAITAGVDEVPAVAQAVTVAAAVTRVLALPGVDAWLRTYTPWLSSAPAAPDPGGPPPHQLTTVTGNSTARHPERGPVAATARVDQE